MMAQIEVSRIFILSIHYDQCRRNLTSTDEDSAKGIEQQKFSDALFPKI